MSIARMTLIAGLVLAVAGVVFRGALPPPGTLSPELRTDPKQTPTRVAPFSVSAGGVDYRVAPQFEYDIAGLVVSRHDTETWWDTIHADSNDHLNVADLCLVWGVNAAEGAYRYMSFHNAQFTCYYSYPGGVPVTAAHVRAVSNNHLLTADPSAARAIRGLRVGDQVRLRGQLASYSHTSGFAFQRGTSTSRDDSENGACETIFVDTVDVLGRAPAWPRALLWIGIALLGLGLVVWYRAPNSDRAW
jgi:hypothetical protein